MHIFHYVERAAQTSPSKTFLKFEKERISFRQFHRETERLASLLRQHGVQPGDRVALLMENHPHFVISLFAIVRLQAIFIPINTFLKHEEVEHILDDATPRLLICGGRFSRIGAHASNKGIPVLYGGKESESRTPHILGTPTTAELPALDVQEASQDVAFLLYTSGTTGQPKGVMLTHANLSANLASIDRAFSPVVNSRRRFLLFLPLFHTFPLTANLLLPLYFGCTIRMFASLRPFSPIFRSLLTERMDVFIAVPAIYSVLARTKIPWYVRMLLGKKLYISGGSPLHEDTWTTLQAKLPGMVLEGYGLSECSPVVAFTPPGKPKVRSVGPALPDVEVKVVDEDLCELPRNVDGELIVRGPNVMKGYYNRPEETASTIINGWLRTGDIARIDEDGYIYIVDRLKDLIITKGMNIYPREIEEVLYQHGAVEHAAVIGIPDEHLDEIAVAYVVLNSEYPGKIDELILKKYLRQHMANYKVPKQIHFIDEIPLNAAGKVMKRFLKEEVLAALDYVKNHTGAESVNAADPQSTVQPLPETPAEDKKTDANRNEE
ncbi:AMP-dependent synthetase and ligase [Desulfurispirillum indicum S5]|uniref:AMP-dependent synthetase and ligase n=1 Tax=Desulfurispirillum indicum (strain ATCC BAA-1389 / DSM 22839 / S5) TaxID=653733 RepID=E6W0A0_DESIS|nr:long-chain-fatty-acid--CoA ligase [Desulfurispirillum indicum]ADU66318.1 AMP-dependent synthetase and ligase [Desulfurispirillum indicum S5]